MKKLVVSILVCILSLTNLENYNAIQINIIEQDNEENFDNFYTEQVKSYIHNTNLVSDSDISTDLDTKNFSTETRTILRRTELFNRGPYSSKPLPELYINYNYARVNIEGNNYIISYDDYVDVSNTISSFGTVEEFFVQGTITSTETVSVDIDNIDSNKDYFTCIESEYLTGYNTSDGLAPWNNWSENAWLHYFHWDDNHIEFSDDTRKETGYAAWEYWLEEYGIYDKETKTSYGNIDDYIGDVIDKIDDITYKQHKTYYVYGDIDKYDEGSDKEINEEQDIIDEEIEPYLYEEYAYYYDIKTRSFDREITVLKTNYVDLYLYYNIDSIGQIKKTKYIIDGDNLAELYAYLGKFDKVNQKDLDTIDFSNPNKYDNINNTFCIEMSFDKGETSVYYYGVDLEVMTEVLKNLITSNIKSSIEENDEDFCLFAYYGYIDGIKCTEYFECPMSDILNIIGTILGGNSKDTEQLFYDVDYNKNEDRFEQEAIEQDSLTDSDDEDEAKG